MSVTDEWMNMECQSNNTDRAELKYLGGKLQSSVFSIKSRNELPVTYLKKVWLWLLWFWCMPCSLLSIQINLLLDCTLWSFCNDWDRAVIPSVPTLKVWSLKYNHNSVKIPSTTISTNPFSTKCSFTQRIVHICSKDTEALLAD